MTTITIPLPWEKPPLTGNDRGHTRYTPFARVKAEARCAIHNAKVRPLVGANVTLHWRIPNKRRRDSDNMGPTLKACLDALVAEGVLPDDSWVHVPKSGNEIHPPNGEDAAMWVELSDVTEYEAGAA